MLQPEPDISVIIVSWNNSGYLKKCFEKLYLQTSKNFDVILIDNGSLDIQEIDSLASNNKRLKIILIKNDENLGFAVANNIGACLSKSKWIALLNADAFPEPDWLEKLLQVAEQNEEYVSFSSRQIQYYDSEKIDGAGDTYHVSGLAWRYGYNQPARNQQLKNREVFSACAAAALIKRELFLEMGGFDEDYFSYFEDVDLGFRLRLIGKKCLYVPEAVVHHVGSGSTGRRSDFSVYYGYRNMIWTYFKNMPSFLLLVFLPLHILSIIFFVLYFTRHKQGKVILRAVFDAFLGLPRIFEKRKLVQRNMKIKPKELLKNMSIGLLEPYFEFVQRNRT